MEEGKYLGKHHGYYYVKSKGYNTLKDMLTDPEVNRKDEFSDRVEQIREDSIERWEKPGANFHMEHRRIITEVLMHLLEKNDLTTLSTTELKVEGLQKINPDQTVFFNGAVGCVEAENKNEFKDSQEKMLRYIRFYFSDSFDKTFPQAKYMRVFIIHPYRQRITDLMEFLLGITYKGVGFKKPAHATDDHIGRNLFRFSMFNKDRPGDFNWFKAADWQRDKEKVKPREVWR